MRGRYLMVLPVPGYCSGPHSFGIESAFALHLRTLRRKLGPLAETLVVVSPELSVAERARASLETIHADEGIVFHPLFPNQLSTKAFYWRLPSIWRTLREEVEQADIVHSGLDTLYRPYCFPALVMAKQRGKKTISVTDIDHRLSARMNYQTGSWSLRQYATTRLIHDTSMHLQQRFATNNFSLVLLKGRRLARDYGRGRPHVKNFLDSAFETEHVIPEARLRAKATAVLDSKLPLEIAYFGRLVPYKGIDHMLRAVRVAIDCGAHVRFRIIGDGTQRAELDQLSAELGLTKHVAFVGLVPFGKSLFDQLYDSHVLLAAPLSQDTPRSALDALAAGMMLLSYDTYYYSELAEAGAPLELVKWRDHKAMGARLVALANDRQRLASYLNAARIFAEPNTQEAWLDKRIGWTRALFENPGHG